MEDDALTVSLGEAAGLTREEVADIKRELPARGRRWPSYVVGAAAAIAIFTITGVAIRKMRA